jgi:cytochrome c553
MKKNDLLRSLTRARGMGALEASGFYRESTMCAGCHGQPEARKEHEQFTTFLKGPASKDGATRQLVPYARNDRANS